MKYFIIFVCFFSLTFVLFCSSSDSQDEVTNKKLDPGKSRIIDKPALNSSIPIIQFSENSSEFNKLKENINRACFDVNNKYCQLNYPKSSVIEEKVLKEEYSDQLNNGINKVITSLKIYYPKKSKNITIKFMNFIRVRNDKSFEVIKSKVL